MHDSVNPSKDRTNPDLPSYIVVTGNEFSQSTARRDRVMAHDRYVELERHPLGGFGFSIIGGVDTHLPPMVCALVHNGSAQLSGKVSFCSQYSFLFAPVSY